MSGISRGKDSGLYDPERQDRWKSRRPTWRSLKAAAACAAVCGVYSLIAGCAGEYSRSEELWPTKAFGPHSSKLHSREEVEKLFASVPDVESARTASRKYAARAHLAGSPDDFESAKDLLELFQAELGIVPPSDPPIFIAGSPQSRSATLGIEHLRKPNAWIDTYYPLMNTPLDRSLTVLNEDGSTLWDAELEEEADPRDPEATKHKDAVPAFHGFSADGEVTGPLIYANYGLKADYDEVVAAGGNFTGKIVLARYGGNARGLKVQAAEQLGALGVLMYSDTRDDGVVTVENGYEPYPGGPARNPTSVERGSVQYLTLYPGDPTTPGKPAYPDAERTEGKNIPTIPSLPVSWENAQRLLKEISDSGLEDAFELNGKTSKRYVKLVNHVDYKITPIWNTMAVIPGHIHNETVIIGNHRDAWVTGAVDPTSGTVSLHEVVRGFGALLKNGWTPLRNIVFASWDAEEYGLIGSTEWTEDFPEWISKTVVAYINIDGSAGGSPWLLTGSPSLAHLIRDAALKVPHPTAAGRTLWDARNDEGPFRGPADRTSLEAAVDKRAVEQTATDVDIGPLGSGSDFTAFLQRLGVASMDESFALAPTDAVYHYHSIYDTETWTERYADPSFEKHVAVAKHLGLVLLRLLDSTIVPLNITHYSLKLDKYLDGVEDTAASLGLAVDLSKLRRSIGHLITASGAVDLYKKDAERTLDEVVRIQPCYSTTGPACWWEKLADMAIGSPKRRQLFWATWHVRRANEKLVGFERGFISEDGLEGREWYKHLGVAPGKWLGYGATTFPAVTEALTVDKNGTLAEKESRRLGSLLDELSARLLS
ncbi:Zn-dependent exopeptidase [Trametes gibbosa]|nr:Zn-dependent exopeptidase [Trametes gibbosa]